MFHNKKNQRGFSLIMGIFLIVVLGGIAVFLGRVATMQYHSSALDEEGVLAYQAARAGVEWGVFQALKVAAPNDCVASTVLVFPVGSLLRNLNYSVTVTCGKTVTYEGDATAEVDVYQITSTAQNAAGGGFHVERQLQVTVTR